MSIYYSDDFVTLYHGDSLEILPTLDLQAAALLTDPPYFKVKKDAWDNQWGGADQFLGWMGDWLDLAKPLLTANASAWVFASPAMTTAVERVVGERFRVLNSVRWVKRAGWHQRSDLESLRSFLTPWEGVIFAEQLEPAYEPLRHYLIAGLRSSGLRMSAVDAKWQEARGTKGCVAIHWFGESQWWMPTSAHYEMMQEVLGGENLPKTYAEVRDWYESTRRPFTITDRALSTDVWDFPTVKPYKGKHPCEKPPEMLRHMIEASTRPGDLILDPFAGSGSALEVARSLGRRAVGIEQDEHWCEQIARKLSAETLDMEEAA